jgi:hypothetical protein
MLNGATFDNLLDRLKVVSLINALKCGSFLIVISLTEPVRCFGTADLARNSFDFL